MHFFVEFFGRLFTGFFTRIFAGIFRRFFAVRLGMLLVEFIGVRVFMSFGRLAGRGRRFGGQRFIMHFVGKRVGFLRCVFVLVLLGVQSFLQLLELGRLDKRFGRGFRRFGAHFGLRFLVLGFGQLLGQRSDILVGKRPAVGTVPVGDRRRARFRIKPVEVAGDFHFGVR